MTHDTKATAATDPGDPAIEAATDHVIETWDQAAPGKDPAVEQADFARMREGFDDLAGRETTADAEG